MSTSSSNVDPRVTQCIEDTVNIQSTAEDFSVFRPLLRFQERTASNHHSNGGETQYLYISPQSAQRDGMNEECTKQGGMPVLFSTFSRSNTVVECHRTGGHANHAALLVALDNVYDCFAATDACTDVTTEDYNLAAAVFLGVTYEWQCSVVPTTPDMNLSLLATPSQEQADFDKQLFDELQLCKSQTEEFRSDNFQSLEQASIEYNSRLETIRPQVHEEPKITTLQFPSLAIEEYSSQCEQAGGQMVGVDSVILECTHIRNGKVSITHYRNYFLCQPKSPPSACTAELMPCDLRHKAELFQASCSIRSGDDNHKCTYTGQSEETEEEVPPPSPEEEPESTEPAGTEAEEEPTETTGNNEAEEPESEEPADNNEAAEEPAPGEAEGGASSESSPETSPQEEEEETPQDASTPQTAAEAAAAVLTMDPKAPPAATNAPAVSSASEEKVHEEHMIEAFFGAIGIAVLVVFLALYCAIRRCKRKRLAKTMSKRAYELTALDLGGSSDHRDDEEDAYTDSRGGLPSLT